MNLHAAPATTARPASARALVNCLRDRSCRLGVMMETSGSSEFHSRDSIRSGGQPLAGSLPDPPLEKTCSGTGREAGPPLTVRCYNTGSAPRRDFPNEVSDAWSAGGRSPQQPPRRQPLASRRTSLEDDNMGERNAVAQADGRMMNHEDRIIRATETSGGVPLCKDAPRTVHAHLEDDR